MEMFCCCSACMFFLHFFCNWRKLLIGSSRKMSKLHIICLQLNFERQCCWKVKFIHPTVKHFNRKCNKHNNINNSINICYKQNLEAFFRLLGRLKMDGAPKDVWKRGEGDLMEAINISSILIKAPRWNKSM